MPEEERCTVAWIKVPLDTNNDNQPTSGQFEYQLVVLTYSGGWYRLAVPYSRAWLQEKDAAFLADDGPSPSNSRAVGIRTRPRSSSIPGGPGRSVVSGHKRKDSDVKEKKERDCKLLEFRRYGRWDGWG